MKNMVKIPLFIVSFILIIIFIYFSISELHFIKLEKKNLIKNEKLEIVERNFEEIDIPNLENNITSNEYIIFDKPSNSDHVWARESVFINSDYLGKAIQSVPTLFNFYNNYFKIEDFLIRANTKNLSNDNDTILIVGDSFVAGHNVLDDNTEWHNLFSEKINKLTKGSKYNIISIGRAGWNFYDYAYHAENLYKTIKFKYLVIGFLPNDFYNYNISMLNPSDDNWRNADWRGGYKYVNCLTGGPIIIKYLSLFEKIFPRTSKELTKLYCSKYLKFINGDKEITMEEQFDVFEKTLYNLKKHSKINNYKIVFMPLNPSIIRSNYGFKNPILNDYILGEFAFKDSGDEELTKIIMNAGFDIVNPRKSNKIAFKDDKSGWVNPIDWHPSIILSYAYADDLYNHFLKNYILKTNFNNIYKPYLFPANLDLYNYFSYIKPSDFYFNFTKFSKDTKKKYITIDNLGKSENMLGTTKSYNNLAEDPNSNLISKENPPQRSLCAKINRPHAELAFNKENFNNIEIKIVNNHPKNNIIVGSKSYDSEGYESYSKGFILKPYENIKLVIDGTLIIASLESGCPLNKPISLPELDLFIEI